MPHIQDADASVALAFSQASRWTLTVYLLDKNFPYKLSSGDDGQDTIVAHKAALAKERERESCKKLSSRFRRLRTKSRSWCSCCSLKIDDESRKASGDGVRKSKTERRWLRGKRNSLERKCGSAHSHTVGDQSSACGSAGSENVKEESRQHKNAELGSQFVESARQADAENSRSRTKVSWSNRQRKGDGGEPEDH